MNFLITNSVPLNGGDEALLRATIEGLKRRYPDCAVTTLCKDVETARKYLLDVELDSDLEFVTPHSLERIGALYRNADIILSAPGSFLHDFYSIEERLRGFEAVLALNKPLILLAQSIGPFWKPESLRRIPQVLNRVSRICVSDASSKEFLLDLGIHTEKIRETGEMGFLWRTLAPECFREKTGPIRLVGLNFRVWPLKDLKAEEEIRGKAQQLCRSLLEQNPDRRLLFLSTCQGIDNYVDDSALATQIVDTLPEELRARCEISRSHFPPKALIEALSECDVFIGMRLHPCVLAMLAGTPAMGIGYEARTREIFGQLGLGPFQIPFESSAPTWLACAREFLDAVENLRGELPSILAKACGRAELNLAVVHEEVRNHQQKMKHGSDAPDMADPPLNPTSKQSEDGLSRQSLTKADRPAPPAPHPLPHPEPGTSSLANLKALQRVIPRGSRFILVDDTQWTGRFPERNPIPFLEKDGMYWGLPADDAKAISELERLRKAGAGFIVFASPCFWWLDYYSEFHSHLERKYQHVFGDEEMIIFDLRTIF